MLHTCWWWFPQWKGNTFNKAICILLLHFYYFALHKKKMTMVLVEVPSIACYLPSSLVQNVVQLSVTWERGRNKKIKPITCQFGKDHSPAFFTSFNSTSYTCSICPKIGPQQTYEKNNTWLLFGKRPNSSTLNKRKYSHLNKLE